MRSEKVDFISSGRHGLYPPRSPDLAVVENVFSILRARLAKMKAATTLIELKANILAVWATITVDDTRALFDSLPRRWAEVRENNGGLTHY